jgi:secreted PhoX family phosphatase
MSQTQMQEIEGTNRSPNETFGDVFQRRLSRRGFLKGALAAAPLFVIGPSAVGRSRPAAASDSTLTFEPIQLCDQDQVIVSPGYEAQVLIRWGEPLHPDVPPLNVQVNPPTCNPSNSGTIAILWPISRSHTISPGPHAWASWR